MRHPQSGTWFIRALVEALYKHASHRDIKTLFEDKVCLHAVYVNVTVYMMSSM